MRPKFFLIAVFYLVVSSLSAQKKALNTTWRLLADYQAALSDGRPERRWLQEAIQVLMPALTHTSTADKPLTWAYSTRVNTLLFGFAMDSLQLRYAQAGKSIPQELILSFYNKDQIPYLSQALESWKIYKTRNPKYHQLFTSDALTEEDQDLKRSVVRMRLDASNLANKMYQTDQLEEAAFWFEASFNLQFDVSHIQDTASWNNACIAALKSKNLALSRRLLEFSNTKQWDQVSFYNLLSQLYLNKNDTLNALECLLKGRQRFPSDLGLITDETNIYIAQKNYIKAKESLQLAISKSPHNPQLLLVLATLNDSEVQQMNSGPGIAEYDVLWTQTEALYLKAHSLMTETSEQKFALLYNLGALYNNQAVKWNQSKPAKGNNALQYAKYSDQQAAVYLNKALPYLEEAYALKPGDEGVKKALKQIYLKIGKPDKAKNL